MAITNIYADKAVSVTDLKRSYPAILDSAGNEPVAVLNHNKPEAYLLPASYFERLLEYLEELEDAALVRERASGPFTEVELSDL